MEDLEAIAQIANGRYKPKVELKEPVEVAPSEIPKAEPETARRRKPDNRVYPIVTAPLYGVVSSQQLRAAPLKYPGSVVLGWLSRCLLPPHRTLRALSWFFNLPGRGWWFMTVATSGKVADEVYDARMRACDNCPQRHLVVIETPDGDIEHNYCEACNCPQWSLSRLTFKNRRSKWICPMRKHPGPYPDNDRRAKLLKDKQVRAFQKPGESGGCPGCPGKGGR